MSEKRERERDRLCVGDWVFVGEMEREIVKGKKNKNKSKYRHTNI
jgi:hypothetical protein